MRTPNLKFILETMMQDQPAPMSVQEKRAFKEAVANFTAMGDSVYGKGDIDEIVERVKKIVEGAVWMVEDALKKLSDDGIVEFDDDKKASMASNLMVVLCGDKEATPVINTGTFHQ